MEQYTKFRGTLGGFNRKDVCSWIEASCKEQRQTIQSLQQEVSRLQQENAQLRQAAREQAENAALAPLETQLEPEPQEYNQMMGELRSLYGRLEEDCSQAKTLLAQAETASQTTEDRLGQLMQLLNRLSAGLALSKEHLFDQVPLDPELP